MGDGEADPLGDLIGPAAAQSVEHPHRHQLCPVGEAGEADAVVGLLGDSAGDVGAVAVFVERQAVAVNEVMAFDELPGGEVGAAAEAPAHSAIGDPGVKHGDGHASGAWVTRRLQVFPGADGVDTAGGDRQQRCRQALPGQEVPLLRDPATGRSRRPAERPGIVGRPSVLLRLPRRWRCSRARRRRRPGLDRSTAAASPTLVCRGTAMVCACTDPVQLDDQPVRDEAVGVGDRPQPDQAPGRASGPRAGSRRDRKASISSLIGPRIPAIERAPP